MVGKDPALVLCQYLICRRSRYLCLQRRRNEVEPPPSRYRYFFEIVPVEASCSCAEDAYTPEEGRACDPAEEEVGRSAGSTEALVLRAAATEGAALVEAGLDMVTEWGWREADCGLESST